MPVAINVHVATKDLSDKRPIPHTPWPLVQPLPNLIPTPTSNPPQTASNALLCSNGTGISNTMWPKSAPSGKPTIKSTRQTLSPCAAIAPQKIPLIPAMRPFKSSKPAADKPINNPPNSGNKKSIICSLKSDVTPCATYMT